jgi:hypothetical protein
MKTGRALSFHLFAADDCVDTDEYDTVHSRRRGVLSLVTHTYAPSGHKDSVSYRSCLSVATLGIIFDEIPLLDLMS